MNSSKSLLLPSVPFVPAELDGVAMVRSHVMSVYSIVNLETYLMRPSMPCVSLCYLSEISIIQCERIYYGHMEGGCRQIIVR